MDEALLLSIGKLSKATGFTVERLRIWELRYGAPKSRRLAKGHRRYGVEEVERLQLVREALSRGLRPRQVAALGREALLQLLGNAMDAIQETEAISREARSQKPWTAAQWVGALKGLDDAFFDRQFYQHWLALGSLRFLTERAQPFIDALELGVVAGALRAGELRYGYEKMGDFLAALWRRLNEDNQAGPVLVSSLPGDSQRLGSQIFALIAALAGLRVLYLGPATLLEELQGLAEEVGAPGILLSLSSGQPPSERLRQLAEFRKSLPAKVFLGTNGAPGGPAIEGVRQFLSLPVFYQWALEWARAHPRRPAGPRP